MVRWKIYKELRIQAVDIYVRLVKKQRHILELLPKIVLNKFVTAASQNFKELKERRIRRQKGAMIACMFFFKYRAHYCRKYRMDFEFRLTNHIRRAINFAAATFLLPPISDPNLLKKDENGQIINNSKWVQNVR